MIEVSRDKSEDSDADNMRNKIGGLHWVGTASSREQVVVMGIKIQVQICSFKWKVQDHHLSNRKRRSPPTQNSSSSNTFSNIHTTGRMQALSPFFLIDLLLF